MDSKNLDIFKKLSQEYGDKFEITISNEGCIKLEPKEYEEKEMMGKMEMPKMSRSEKLKQS